jgi:hypothetical protein
VSASVDAQRTGDLTGPVTPGSSALRRFPALTYCAGIYLIVRVALFLLSAAAWGLAGDGGISGGSPGWTGTAKHPVVHNGWVNMFTGWYKLDSTYFLAIARSGYEAHRTTAAFDPGYPILIRAASYLTFGNYLAAALLVSNIALLAALVVLYRLTEREFDVPTARRTILYLCLFPTAFFLFAAYSEAIFLLAVVGALALARSRHWAWASLAGIAATLTRSTGVFLVLALAVEAIHQTVEDRRSAGTGANWRDLVPGTVGRLAASAVPLAGTVGYLLYWQLRFHDWAYPLSLEKSNWGRQFTLPWVSLWRGLNSAVFNGPLANNAWGTFDFVLVVVGLALGVWVAMRTRPVYAVFTWGAILLFLAESWSRRPLASDPRYLVVLFPLMWALARLGRDSRVNDAIIALSTASLAICAWLFLTTIQVY